MKCFLNEKIFGLPTITAWKELLLVHSDQIKKVCMPDN